MSDTSPTSRRSRRQAARRRKRLALLITAIAVVVVAAVAVGGTFTYLHFSKASSTKAVASKPKKIEKSSTISSKPEAPAPAPEPTSPLKGLKILIDPGHNGSPKQHRFNARQVPDGRGGHKNCQTFGTTTASGFTEHTFNWKVANFLKAKLEADGAIVTLTRDSDDGMGPCVDERGAMSKGKDVVLSIHADGTYNTRLKGYFAMTSSPPLNEAQGQPSVDLALAVNKALGQAGFAPSNIYKDQLYKRSDIAGLNFSQAPMVMMELGQMKNPEEAKVMESEAGQKRYADALYEGLKAWAAAREKK